MDIKKIIETFVVNELLLGRKASLGEHESLIGGGFLDSLTLLELIAFVEKRFNVKIEDHEMTLEHFETIARMTELVSRKQAGTPSS